MKKVLILAYDFPPYNSVGGLRPYSWYKYFSEFGYYPIVITRQWSCKFGNNLDYVAKSDSDNLLIEETEIGTIIRTPYKPNFGNKLLLKYGEKKYKNIRRIVTAYYEICQWLWIVGPKSELYFAAQHFLKENKVDVIIATAEPFVLFKYAVMLKKEFKIPWIADYRDNWCLNKNRNKNIFFHLINRVFEPKYIKDASKVISVANLTKHSILQGNKNINIEIVCNGFDLVSDFERENPINNELNIAFAGNAAKYYNIEEFVSVYYQFLKSVNFKDVKLYLIGVDKKHNIINELSKFPSLQNCVIEVPKLSNFDYLKFLSSMDALLLFNDYYATGTKIFDYLLVKRKIIFCFNDLFINSKNKIFYDVNYKYLQGMVNDHVQADIIRETNSGIVINNQKHLLTVFNDLLIEKNEKGFIKCNSVNTEKYSRRLQTQKLAQIIDDIV